ATAGLEGRGQRDPGRVVQVPVAPRRREGMVRLVERAVQEEGLARTAGPVLLEKADRLLLDVGGGVRRFGDRGAPGLERSDVVLRERVLRSDELLRSTRMTPLQPMPVMAVRGIGMGDRQMDF